MLFTLYNLYNSLKPLLRIRCIRRVSDNSQTCARCHHVHPERGKSYRSGERFKCGNCGWKHNADVNASFVISQLSGVYVSHPEISGIACQLEGQISLLPMNYA